MAVIEDVGVPVEELPLYLRSAQELLQQHETTASFLVHAGTGQVHTRPFLDLQRPHDAAKLWALADEIHGLALEMGGTVSARSVPGVETRFTVDLPAGGPRPEADACWNVRA